MDSPNIHCPPCAFEYATIGGTFDAMHAGHQRYIDLAFFLARRVAIHVTSDAYAARLKPYQPKPYAVRVQQITAYVLNRGWSERSSILTVDSPEEVARFCVEHPIDVAVVEPRYFRFFLRIRREILKKDVREFCLLLKPRTQLRPGVDLSSSSL